MWLWLIDVLGRLRWKPARHLAAGLDLLRSVGPTYGWRGWRERSARARLGDAPVRATYAAIWGEAARDLGATMVDLSGGFLELRKGPASTRVWNHWVMLDDAVTIRLALDKPRVHQLMAQADLPVPEHLEFHYREPNPALALVEGDGGWVVKPASGTSLGEGVTTGVRTRADLLRAVTRASRGDARLLIERQVPGDAYRLLFLGGELLGVVRRLPPGVTGDGRSTIAELIAAENRRRLDGGGREGFHLLRVDLDCVLALNRQGLRLGSVPPDGARVAVKGVVSQNAPRDNETVSDGLSDELVAAARAAAHVVGLRLAGIDLTTPDPSRSLAESGGAILEVNGTPGLHYHYQVADRANVARVAVPVLRRLLADATASA
jgi:D-alanine-D-alanine ligase-like ATP-grasp enzyme